MGNFIVSIILIAFIIILTVANSLYISSLCEEMISLIDSGDIEGAYKLWEENRDYISVFVRDAEVDVADAESKNFESGVAIEDGEAANLRFKEAIEEILNSEHVNLINIF